MAEKKGLELLRLPGAMVLRVVAPSLLLAVAVLSLPLLRAALLSPLMVPGSPDPLDSDLGTILRDLRREGLFSSGARGLFLGDAAGARVGSVLGDDGVWSVPVVWEGMVGDLSVDVLLAEGRFGGDSFAFVDRVLKIGGIAVAKLSSDPADAFRVPENYRLVYIRRFSSTVAAMKKIAHAGDDTGGVAGRASTRRLMSAAAGEAAMPNQIDDVMLEPPTGEWLKKSRQAQLSQQAAASADPVLNEYPRRMFIDVGTLPTTDVGRWFEKNYPRAKEAEFDIIRLGVVKGGKAARTGSISDWMRQNVRGEDYVVMKAEAAVAEEMVKGNAIRLVDEMFLECKNQWQKGKRSKRAYWECLALYGKLNDQGVAVHQWWG